jgi:hypothetical protein
MNAVYVWCVFIKNIALYALVCCERTVFTCGSARRLIEDGCDKGF